MIGNKIADKITSVSKKSNNSNNNNNNSNNDNNNEDVELPTHKKRYISPEERQEIINELRLVPKKDEYFNVNFKKHISIKERWQIIDKLKVGVIV